MKSPPVLGDESQPLVTAMKTYTLLDTHMIVLEDFAMFDFNLLLGFCDYCVWITLLLCLEQHSIVLFL